MIATLRMSDGFSQAISIPQSGLCSPHRVRYLRRREGPPGTGFSSVLRLPKRRFPAGEVVERRVQRAAVEFPARARVAHSLAYASDREGSSRAAIHRRCARPGQDRAGLPSTAARRSTHRLSVRVAASPPRRHARGRGTRRGSFLRARRSRRRSSAAAQCRAPVVPPVCGMHR